MSDTGRHGTDTVFVAATGPHDWAEQVWQRGLRHYPGDWRNAGNPGELLELHARLSASGVTPRYAFFLHWSWRVPDDIVRSWECVNFHMTALPYGRGGSPLQHLILRGHRYTLLTAHRMTDELDAGPIYAQAPLALTGRAEEIYRRAMWRAAVLARRIIAEEPPPVPQSGAVEVWRRRTPEESDIRAKPPDVSLYDFIRMLDAPGYPAAFVEQDGRRYAFTHAEPGEDWLRPGDTLTARVRITEWKEEGRNGREEALV